MDNLILILPLSPSFGQSRELNVDLCAKPIDLRGISVHNEEQSALSLKEPLTRDIKPAKEHQESNTQCF